MRSGPQRSTKLFTLGVFLTANLFFGLDAGEVRPVKEAFILAERDAPLFVIHSTTDEVVPYEHARLFWEAYSEADLWRLGGYEHVTAYTTRDTRRIYCSFCQRLWPKIKVCSSGSSKSG